MTRGYPEKVMRRACQIYREGTAIRFVSEIVEVETGLKPSATTVRKWLHDCGEPLRPNRPHRFDHVAIRKLVAESEVSILNIARLHGCSPMTVWNIARAAGVVRFPRVVATELL